MRYLVVHEAQGRMPMRFYVSRPEYDAWTGIREKAYEFDLDGARAFLARTAQQSSAILPLSPGLIP